ncbi:unnamed protein product [Discula destructiva]
MASSSPPSTTTTNNNASKPSKMLFSATYTSATNNAPFTLTHTLAAPPSGTASPTVPDKTAYLAALRSATAGLQEQINKELTQRMDEDNNNNNNNKAAAAASRALVDEAQAEENYGEEAQEDDE